MLKNKQKNYNFKVKITFFLQTQIWNENPRLWQYSCCINCNLQLYFGPKLTVGARIVSVSDKPSRSDTRLLDMKFTGVTGADAEAGSTGREKDKLCFYIQVFVFDLVCVWGFTHSHPDPAKTFPLSPSCSLFWIVWVVVLIRASERNEKKSCVNSCPCD